MSMHDMTPLDLPHNYTPADGETVAYHLELTPEYINDNGDFVPAMEHRITGPSGQYDRDHYAALADNKKDLRADHPVSPKVIAVGAVAAVEAAPSTSATPPDNDPAIIRGRELAREYMKNPDGFGHVWPTIRLAREAKEAAAKPVIQLEVNPVGAMVREQAAIAKIRRQKGVR